MPNPPSYFGASDDYYDIVQQAELFAPGSMAHLGIGGWPRNTTRRTLDNARRLGLSRDLTPNAEQIRGSRASGLSPHGSLTPRRSRSAGPSTGHKRRRPESDARLSATKRTKFYHDGSYPSNFKMPVTLRLDLKQIISQSCPFFWAELCLKGEMPDPKEFCNLESAVGPFSSMSLLITHTQEQHGIIVCSKPGRKQRKPPGYLTRCETPFCKVCCGGYTEDKSAFTSETHSDGSYKYPAICKMCWCNFPHREQLWEHIQQDCDGKNLSHQDKWLMFAGLFCPDAVTYDKQEDTLFQYRLEASKANTSILPMDPEHDPQLDEFRRLLSQVWDYGRKLKGK